MTTGKKVTKKKPTTKLEEVKNDEVKEEEKPKLTELEMVTIDSLTKDIRLKELEVLVIAQKKRIMDMEFERESTKKREEYAHCKDRKSRFLAELEDKYNMDTEMKGFVPITGEIKDE